MYSQSIHHENKFIFTLPIVLSSSGGVSITVTVLATNVLGQGPISDTVVFEIPECDGIINSK
jgi:hypothetical protein